MPFTYLTNLPLEQAEERYPAWLAEGGFQPKTETVPAAQSAGRVTARAVYATLWSVRPWSCWPPWEPPAWAWRRLHGPPWSSISTPTPC